MTPSPMLNGEEYARLLDDLKARIRGARIRAALAVNRELALLYWQIGRAIAARQEAHGWGAQVIARLSADLRRAFPDLKGFSPRNLQYMRTFAGAYPDEAISQQVAAQLPWGRHVRFCWNLVWALPLAEAAIPCGECHMGSSRLRMKTILSAIPRCRLPLKVAIRQVVTRFDGEWNNGN